jgi:hypothetical protein
VYRSIFTLLAFESCGHTMEQRLRYRRSADAGPDTFVKCRLSIPTSTNARLIALKARHTLRNRDAVIGALIRRARAEFQLAEFNLPAEPADDDPMIDIYPTIQLEHVAFLYRLQRRFRGAALGTTIEALIETVGDIAPLPVQLSLLTGGMRL